MHPFEPSPADSGRRNFLVAGTAAVAALSLPAFASAATPARASSTSPTHPTSHGATPMSNFVTRPDGATLPDLIAATDWLPHTTRAALTGLRKKGHNIARDKRDGVTCYRIVEAA